MKETSSQNSESNTVPVQKNDTMSKPVSLFNHSQKSQPETQDTGNDSTANIVRDDKIPPLTITAPQIEGKLVGDETAIELYLPPSSIIVFNAKNER